MIHDTWSKDLRFESYHFRHLFLKERVLKTYAKWKNHWNICKDHLHMYILNNNTWNKYFDIYYLTFYISFIIITCTVNMHIDVCIGRHMQNEKIHCMCVIPLHMYISNNNKRNKYFDIYYLSYFISFIIITCTVNMHKNYCYSWWYSKKSRAHFFVF
jgi:hypothetical protein